MKKIVLLSLLLFSFFSSFATEIDAATAMNIAKNFYTSKAAISNATSRTTNSGQSLNPSLAYTCISNENSSKTNENIYYIFNIGARAGFVIISADDAVTPVLAYSTKGQYDSTNLSFKSWIDGYKQQILYVKTNNITATDDIKASWSELSTASNSSQERTLHTASVSPLLSTTWNQGNTDASTNGYYNNLCPISSSLPDGDNNTKHCPTGCVATAMAQIMKFWSYPASGIGINSYSTASYGTLSANFGATTYNWSSMPDNVTAANTAVATLMYQCGVSVNMGYGPDGSSAYVIYSASTPACAQNAYVKYFGYNSSTIQGLTRSNYADAAWINLLENELNNGRPLQYAGIGTDGGHTFVFDGYDASNYFDVNWGWGGADDGYFTLAALNPSILGAGGGAGSYNSDQVAVIGIQPIVSTSTTIVMNSSITITPNPINFDQSFTVNFDVENSGSTDFSGVYCAALFDASGNFITYIDSISTGGSPLPPGYHYTSGLSFTNTLLTVPGNYIIGGYYKPTGGNWILIGSVSYTNPVSVTINGPVNLLELYSNIVSTPTTFTQGQAASVNVNLVNNNSYTYYGQYEAVLLDLAGNYVETIGTYLETSGLPAGYTYSSPYITFSTSNITASPGTYILAIAEEESATSTWYYAGANGFSNPINVTVVAPTLQPDIYEPDNTPATAYNFPINWSNNKATIQTTGSNINNSTDVDYYNINLASGYNYTITANALDNNNSAYTCDVLWAYDAGSGYSPLYQDNNMPGNITIDGSGAVIFYVAPYFQGLTGTYLLNINLSRQSTTGINTINSSGDGVSVYPVPNNGQFNVSLAGNGYNTLKVYDILGKEVYTQTLDEEQADKTLLINLSSAHSGIYIMSITSQQGAINKKIIVQ